MEYRRLGKSGLQVSALSFGSWVTFAKQVDTGLAKELLGAAYEAGVISSITPRAMSRASPRL
jgi:aryl-alcohol dehydrogenase-like predicted oxidoreductase